MNSFRLVRPLSYALFALVLLQLPAELPVGVIRVHPLIMTGLETTVGACLLVTFFRWLHAKRTGTHRRSNAAPAALTVRLREPALWVLIWLATQFVAAFLAPELRGGALKFAVRSAGIASLFWVTLYLHRTSRDPWRAVRVTMGSIAAIAALIAVLGALELTRGEIVQPFLRFFRVVPKTVDGALRLTASFSHANQAASFLEMALPLAIALAFAARRAWRWVWMAVGCGVLCGLFATLTRGAIVAASAVVGVQLAASAVSRPARRTALAGLAILGAMWVAWWQLDPAFRHRAGTRGPARGLAASVQAPAQVTLQSGSSTRVEVQVANRGYLTWPADGVAPVRLAYHVFDARTGDSAEHDATAASSRNTERTSCEPSSAAEARTDALWVFDGTHTALPRAVRPGDSVHLAANFQASVPPGNYIIAWDLIREGVAWFSQHGTAFAETHLEVSAAPDARIRTTREPIPPGMSWTTAPDDPSLHMPRSLLWRAALASFASRPLTGTGPDSFRRTYGRTLGLEKWNMSLHAHNLYLELLATTGLIGLLAWLGLLIAFLPAVRSGFAAASRGADPIGLGLAGTLAVFSLHGVVDCFLAYYGSMGIFWIAAGLLAVWTRMHAEDRACA